MMPCVAAFGGEDVLHFLDSSVLRRAGPDGNILSVRQFEVAELVARGVRNKEIAVRLGISEATVKSHVACACKAVGVTTRVALAVAWIAGQAGSVRGLPAPCADPCSPLIPLDPDLTGLDGIASR